MLKRQYCSNLCVDVEYVPDINLELQHCFIENDQVAS